MGSLLAVLLSVVAGLGVAAPTAASASGCLQTVGTVINVTTRYGYHLGTFYQGYNFCTRTTYAEMDWADSGTWVRTAADSDSIISVTHNPTPNDNGWIFSNTGTPGPAASWVNGFYSINYPFGDQYFTASFDLRWNGYDCNGFTQWNYTNGTAGGWNLSC